MTQHEQSIANTTAHDELGRAAKAKQDKAPGQPPPRAARGGCHGWTVRMAVVAVPPPVVWFSFATFRFFGDFARFATIKAQLFSAMDTSIPLIPPFSTIFRV